LAAANLFQELFMSARALAIFFFFLLSFLSAPKERAQSKSIAQRLGYPADSKLLILHADDLAVSHSVNAASFAALDTNAVTSASVMVPCPWLTEVASYAKSHRDADLGLHLTLTSEWETYRWGPVESTDKVSSLLALDGYLWPATESAAQNIKVEEVEREIHAQIDRAIVLGIRPTHLDSHMGVLFATPQLFSVFVKVAHEYKLPFLAVRVTDERSRLLSLLSEKDIVLDSLVMADPSVTLGTWEKFYASAIRNLKSGLTEIIVHLGHDDAELQAVTFGHPEYGAAWRQRDFDVVTSSAFKKLLEENHVVLVRWRDLGKLLQ
jgi:predicted glycoside hydrolase/deacetylase ChbG (UPF0249 family)